MTVSYRARCREKRPNYQRAVNQRIELHNFTCTFKTRFEGGKMQRPNLKLVKVDDDAPGTCFAGRFFLCDDDFASCILFPTISANFPPFPAISYHFIPFHSISRMAGFPLTQDDWPDIFIGDPGVPVSWKPTHFGLFVGLDSRHSTSSTSLCFYKKTVSGQQKRGCIWLHVSCNLDSISYNFDFVCYKFWSKMCLLQWQPWSQPWLKNMRNYGSNSTILRKEVKV